MRKALTQLLSDAERYIIIIRRSRTIWESGDAQAPELTLFEEDPIAFDNELDPRFVRSRRVTIVLVDKARGIAEINLTARSWRILQESSTIRQRLITFNAELITGSRGRFITSNYANLILTTPLWCFVLAYLIWTVSSVNNFNWFYGKNIDATGPGPAIPDGLTHFATTMFALWPAFLVSRN